ncbi:MAG: hypothetical protein AAGF33_08175 [Pseudomonadota bacterium]
MIRTSLIAAVGGVFSIGLAVAQDTENAAPTEQAESPAILVEDPEQGEIEIFEAQGATEAEIVTPADMAAEAEVTAVMENDITGDMAAMPEVAEDPEW